MLKASLSGKTVFDCPLHRKTSPYLTLVAVTFSPRELTVTLNECEKSELG